MTETSDWVEETGSVETVDTTADGWTIVFRLDGQLTQIVGGAWETEPNWRSEPSALTTWRATVPETTALERWQLADAFIYYDSELLLRGEFHNPTTTESTGTTQLEGKDILRKLERGGTDHTYVSIEAFEAIAHYADEYLEEWAVTVHEPDPDLIDEDLTVQEAELEAGFNELYPEFDDDVPAAVSGDGVENLQTCFNLDGWGDREDSSTGTNRDAEDYSGVGGDTGVGVALELENTGETGVYEFNIEHTIPESELGLWIRHQTGADANPEATFRFDGTTLGSVTSQIGFSDFLNWSDIASGAFGFDPWDGGDISPGTYTFEIEAGDDSQGGWYAFDRIAVTDNRFNYNFDNDPTWTGSANALDGPELFPDSVQVESASFNQSFNITDARLTTTFDDTDGSQRLEVSNDGGDTWIGAENAEEIDETFDSVGSTIASRITFGRGEPNGPADTTPRFGYSGQRMESYELAIDTNDIAVIDETEFVGSHWENLQRLMDRSRMVGVPEYDSEELRLDVLTPGSVERTVDWTVLDSTRDPDTTDYANAITVFGAVDEETGDRLVATAEVQSEIEAHGRFEAAPVFEDDVASEEALANIARTELGRLVAESSMRGTVEIVPKPIRPGFGYAVDQLDGEILPLWATEFDLSGTGSLEFGERDDLAGAFVGIRVDVRELRG